MFNLGLLANTVQKNCHISDARHAGDYTLCIFLLKMREFYRWENDIPFSRTLPNEEVGQWLQEREQMWNGLEDSPFESLPLEGGTFDPFDTGMVNRELTPQGYVYSGGYGRFCKPHFFLGDLSKYEQRNGYSVYIASCEYARDLVAPPAMLQGETIFIRQESVRRFLWEKIDEWRWNQKNEAMRRALACYGFNPSEIPENPHSSGGTATMDCRMEPRSESNLSSTLEHMTANETEAMILHELGEAQAGEVLDEAWHQMLDALSRSKAEIMARAVRDNLADCLSTLPGLLKSGNEASLHFFFANFSGMRKHLFPEAMNAYHDWINTDNLEPLHQLAETGQSRWRGTARVMLDIYKNEGAKARTVIEQQLDKTPM